MPSVASQAVLFSHHGQVAAGRSTTAASKAPETPFAQLLDQLGPPADDQAPGAPESAAQGNQAPAAETTTAAKSKTPADDRAPQPNTGAAKPDDKSSDAAQTGAEADIQDPAIQVTTATTGTKTNDQDVTETVAKSDADGDGQNDSGKDADASTVQTVAAALDTTGTDAGTLTPVAVAVTAPLSADSASTPTQDPEQGPAAVPVATDGKKISGAAAQSLPVDTNAKGAADADADAPSQDAADQPQQTANVPLTTADATTPPTPKPKARSDASAIPAAPSEPPGNADDDEAPSPDLSSGLGPQPAAAPGQKPAPARPGVEALAGGKPERHVGADDTAPDTLLAATADAAAAAAGPVPDGNAPAADALQTAPGSDHPVASAQSGAAMPPTTAVPIAGLAVEIAARVQAGSSRFEIRLDPPELGRVEVRLDVDKSGHVSSRLIVDRPDTLDLLQRDAGDLQRALQQAGLTTSDDGLQFSLRDQGFAGYGNNNPSSTAQLIIPDPDLVPVDSAAAGYTRVLTSSGGIDIRV